MGQCSRMVTSEIACAIAFAKPLLRPIFSFARSKTNRKSGKLWAGKREKIHADRWRANRASGPQSGCS